MLAHGSREFGVEPLDEVVEPGDGGGFLVSEVFGEDGANFFLLFVWD